MTPSPSRVELFHSSHCIAAYVRLFHSDKGLEKQAGLVEPPSICPPPFAEEELGGKVDFLTETDCN